MAKRFCARAAIPFWLLVQSACRPGAPVAPASAQRGAGAAQAQVAPVTGAGFRCNLLLGVAVTSEWFDAGFERAVADQRWESITKPHTSIEQWGDPHNSVWSLSPSSPCSEQSLSPDRVLFTAMNWEYTTAAEWEAGLTSVVHATLTRFPDVRRIELLSMIRAPGNVSCGNAMSVVAPFVDRAIRAVAARFPERVSVGPELVAPNCEVFKNGGPHFTEAGRQVMAQRAAEYFAREP